jgi:NhaA family Na+:H+ antiporter
MTIPARTRIDADQFAYRGRAALDAFDEGTPFGGEVMSNSRHQAAVRSLENLCEDVQAPLLRMEDKLQGIVAFVIVPLFALANAGLPVTSEHAALSGSRISLGVILGLLFGKPIGITLFAWAAVRLRLAALPRGVTMAQIHAVSWLGGIGFTMSLFIGDLAFDSPGALQEAKAGILVASVAAAGVAWLALRVRTRRRDGDRSSP